jgi:hypothetical protein
VVLHHGARLQQHDGVDIEGINGAHHGLHDCLGFVLDIPWWQTVYDCLAPQCGCSEFVSKSLNSLVDKIYGSSLIQENEIDQIIE